MSWQHVPDRDDWASVAASDELLSGGDKQIPDKWRTTCLDRLKTLREQLQSDYVGLDEVTDSLLATLIARENALLIGPPGTAKSELPLRLYQLLGLTSPRVDRALLVQGLGETDPYGDWERREASERKQQKYFHYLVGRFTQPEELFGPIEIGLLRKGMLVRVNFGLMTGAGVRAVFLDEVFKASSNILNTLLTLSQERRYFNWGEMRPADLAMLIAASNELPGSLTAGVGSALEDFQTLHAFIDRFPVRLLVAVASISDQEEPTDSNMAKAFDKAVGRERERFRSGLPFGRTTPAGMPCINDILCLGRAMMEDSESGGGFFDRGQVSDFRGRFLSIAKSLYAKARERDPDAAPSWTLSPRKLKALYKIGLAHALVRGVRTTTAGPQVDLAAADLAIFKAAWDSLEARAGLGEIVDLQIENHGP
jgi:hypothetical protein